MSINNPKHFRHLRTTTNIMANYQMLNGTPYVEYGTSFEHMVWFVQFRKPQQKRLKRLLRSRGMNKKDATRYAHQVYIESNREAYLMSLNHGNRLAITFRYCF